MTKIINGKYEIKPGAEQNWDFGYVTAVNTSLLWLMCEVFSLTTTYI